jgi:hypothetical protein
MTSARKPFVFFVFAAISCIVFCSFSSAGQTFLEIRKFSFQGLTKYQVYQGEALHLKLIGSLHWQTRKLVNVTDSTMIFSDESELNFSKIKKIKLTGFYPLARTFQGFFLGLGLGFFPLNTINELIVKGNDPIFSSTAALISAGLLCTSFALRELTLKRIKINHRVTLQKGQYMYEHINEQ